MKGQHDQPQKDRKLSILTIDEELLAAVRAGLLSDVVSLLARGASANAARPDGWTALMLACRNGDVAVVSSLLDAGAVVSACAEPDVDAFAVASLCGHVTVLEVLLAAGARADGDHGSAASGSCLPSTDSRESGQSSLPSRGASPTALPAVNARNEEGLTLLAAAAESGLVDRARALLASGADVDAGSPSGQTPLMLACKCGRSEVVDLLVERGADVNAVDGKNRTALMFASLRGDSSVVEALLARGADESLSDEDGETALTLAAQRGRTQVVRALLGAGMPVDGRRLDGRSALSLASEEGCGGAVRELIRAGACLDALDSAGYSVLGWAIVGGHPDIVRTLLRSGADVAAEVRGMTPLMFASLRGDLRVVQALLAAGAGVHNTSPDGVDAVMLAASRGHDDVVVRLIQSGADVRRRSRDGLTAVHKAMRGGHVLTAQELVLAGAPTEGLPELSQFRLVMESAKQRRWAVVDAVRDAWRAKGELGDVAALAVLVDTVRALPRGATDRSIALHCMLRWDAGRGCSLARLRRLVTTSARVDLNTMCVLRSFSTRDVALCAGELWTPAWTANLEEVLQDDPTLLRYVGQQSGHLHADTVARATEGRREMQCAVHAGRVMTARRVLSAAGGWHSRLREEVFSFSVGAV